VGVNLPADNRDGRLALVDSAITQSQLQQQIGIDDKCQKKNYPQNGHGNNEHVGVV